VCNWFGGLAAAESLSWPGSLTFKHAKEENYSVDGKVGGTFKNVGNLSRLRVFEAGHQVPFFRKFNKWWFNPMERGED
jgi:carboxypeptidase C (cathepsin A)